MQDPVLQSLSGISGNGWERGSGGICIVRTNCRNSNSLSEKYPGVGDQAIDCGFDVRAVIADENDHGAVLAGDVVKAEVFPPAAGNRNSGVEVPSATFGLSAMATSWLTNNGIP